MTSGWHEQLYPLRYQFGDRTAFSWKLRLLVRQLTLDEGISQAAVPAALAGELPRGFDGFMIRAMPYSGPAGTVQRDGPYLQYVVAQQPRFYLPLTGDFETYAKERFSSKTRSTLGRKIRRWAEHSGGKVLWKAYTTPGELRQEFYPQARTISAATYQERLFDAGLPTDDEFVAHMEQAAAADLVRAFLIFDGDTPVAFLYLDAEGGTLSYSYLGFLPQYRDWSVGTILHWFAFEYLFTEQRFQLFDFTEGNGEHKRFFATANLEVANMLFLRRTARNEMMLRGHRATAELSGWAGRALDRWGLKARMRRVLRYGVRAGWSKTS